MELDDVTQTGELPETHGAPARKSPVPWVLLGVVTAVLLAAGGVGWVRALQASQRIDDAEESRARAEADAAAKTARVEELEKQASEHDAQVKALTAEKDALAEQVKALEAKAGQAPAAAATASKAPAKKPTKKKSTKRRRR